MSVELEVIGPLRFDVDGNEVDAQTFSKVVAARGAERTLHYNLKLEFRKALREGTPIDRKKVAHVFSKPKESR